MINVKLGYSWTNYETLDWEKFKSYWPLAPEDKPASYYSLPMGPTRLTEAEAMALVNLGCPLEIVPYPNAMIVKMQGERKWSYGEEVTVPDLQSGAAIQITIPDLALLLIDEVTYRDDCCTDELQNLLDDGWRLLAVCPPNAQRRPDYILGRRKEK